jgi:hypothetical protein
MEKICALINPPPKCDHITDFLKSGTKDKEWIQRIAKDSNWVVITADGGHQSRKGDKLPELCAEHGIRHLVLSPKVSMKKTSEKVGALLQVWEEIQLLHNEQPGKRWDLKIKPTKTVDVKVGITVWIDKSRPKQPKKPRPKA